MNEVPLNKDQRYYQRHKARLSESMRVYYEKNKERIKARVSERAKQRRREMTPEEKSEYDRIRNKRYKAQHDLWIKNNPRDRTEYSRNYFQKNKLKRYEYYRNNKEKDAAWHKKYRNTHKEQRSAYHKKYRAEHPDACRNHWQTRRARVRNATINLNGIKDFLKKVKQKRTATCYYCEREFNSKAAHIDHIIPLARGGPHSVENLCVSCRECNLEKNAKRIDEWIKLGQQVFPI